MNAVVFEHVPVAELPEKWRARLTQAGASREPDFAEMAQGGGGCGKPGCGSGGCGSH